MRPALQSFFCWILSTLALVAALVVLSGPSHAQSAADGSLWRQLNSATGFYIMQDDEPEDEVEGDSRTFLYLGLVEQNLIQAQMCHAYTCRTLWFAARDASGRVSISTVDSSFQSFTPQQSIGASYFEYFVSNVPLAGTMRNRWEIRAGTIVRANMLLPQQRPVGPQVFTRVDQRAFFRTVFGTESPSQQTIRQIMPGTNLASPAVSAGPRIAVVIGISQYQSRSLSDLSNPINDAQLVSAALRQVGFQVQLVINPNITEMRSAIQELGNQIARSGPGSTALVYFAGHGVQWNGRNYLIPAAAQINSTPDLELSAIPADVVALYLERATGVTGILILDACRNTPIFQTRSLPRGLAEMRAPTGTFIAYSTAPGSVAADGEGANSPYALAVSREIVMPGRTIEEVFRLVRRSVRAQTSGAQNPWESSNLDETFYFVP